MLGTVGIMVLTYYGSRWYVARFAKAQGSLTGGNYIKVVERLIVSKTASIIIIDIQGVQYMVGVNEHNIQMLTQLDEPISLQQKEEISKESFLSMFKSLTQKEK